MKIKTNHLSNKIYSMFTLNFRYAVCCFCFCCSYALLYAQEENTFEKEFENFTKKTQQEQKHFEEKIDQEFTQFLKKAWQSHQVIFEPEPPKKPYPKTQPVAPIQKPEPKPEPQPQPKPKPEPKPEPQPQPKPKPEPKPEPQSIPKPNLPIDDFKGKLDDQFAVRLKQYMSSAQHQKQFHFNHQININLFYNADIQFQLKTPLQNTSFAEAWQSLAQTNYKMLIDQLSYYAHKMKLNDFGYALLIKDAAKSLFPDKPAKQNVFTWFILNKTGYLAKIAQHQNNVVLLVPTPNQLYNLYYLTMPASKQKYYIIDLDNKFNYPAQVKTYATEYNTQGNNIDFNHQVAPLFPKKARSKKLSFQYKQQNIDLHIQYSTAAIAYYKRFPMLYFDVYFNTPLSAVAMQSLANAIKPHLHNKTEQEKVQFILSFMQKAFQYKTDPEQFGYENYLYPEESLHYPYCDCEDRSFLFKQLVENLVKLKVVGLYWEGHVAAAVQFNQNVQGAYYLYKNQKYTITDPTYIGAKIGMCMPKYQNKKVTIIE